MLKNYAESGNLDAINRLGNMYYYGKTVEKNTNLALYWYKKGAKMGDWNCKKMVEKMEST